MVEQSAGCAVGGVHWAEEAPGLREQLAYGGGAHLAEEGSSVDTAEVGQIAEEVELVCYHREPRLLERGREGGKEGRREGGEGGEEGRGHLALHREVLWNATTVDVTNMGVSPPAEG